MTPRIWALSLLLAALCTYAVYQPGLSGTFFFDDRVNILENDRLRAETLDWRGLKQIATAGIAGPTGRPLSMLSLGLNLHYFGASAYSFKLVNLMLHIVNGLLLAALTLLLLAGWRNHDSRSAPDQTTALWIALIAGGLWMLHPLNLTGVLYVVQRMTSLSALFTIAGLAFYALGRLRQVQQRRGLPWILAAWLVCLPMAVLSKENGLLLPVLLLLAEAAFFRFQARTRLGKQTLIGLYAAVILLPATVLVVSLASQAPWLFGAYQIRDFTMLERLLTEARVIWYYVGLTFAPSLGELSFYHDDFVISRGLLDPWTTLAALLGLAAAIIGGLACLKKFPLVGFGILFFLAGHAMESSFIGLELIHEHRNYLPDYGLLLVAGYVLGAARFAVDTVTVRRFAGAALIAALTGLTLMRAQLWQNPADQFVFAVRHHPDSPRINQSVGRIYAIMSDHSQGLESSINFSLAHRYFQRATALRPNFTTGLFSSLVLYRNNDQMIPESLVDQLTDRLAHQPVTAASVNSLNTLVHHYGQPDNRLPPALMEGLFNAVLSNPTLTDTWRSSFYSLYSAYAANQRHDYRSALAMAKLAVGYDRNNADRHLSLADLLLALGKLDAAADEIGIAGQLDTWGGHAKRIQALTEKLRDRRAAAGIPGLETVASDMLENPEAASTKKTDPATVGDPSRRMREYGARQ